MNLQYKPDFEETKVAWRHFWAREKWKRPLVVANVPRDPAHTVPWDESPYNLHYYLKFTGDWAEYLRRIDRWLEHRLWLAEAVPFFDFDFGPDEFAAFLGAPLKFELASSSTSWVEPIIEDWRAFEFKLDPANPVWTRMRELARQMAQHARGRYLVGTCDLHSNADTLSALRHGEQLCMDFFDQPEQIDRAMRAVRRLYQPVYDGLYEASGSNTATGSIGWIPTWSDGKFASVQCDFLCMVSPAISRQFIIPALAEEAAFLDHCIYHLDGPGALPHLDDILAIQDIDAIQWVSGAGQKPMWQWLDVLKRCQQAGKALQIFDLNCEQAKQVHHELGPAGVVYCVAAKTAAEVEDLSRWLERNS
jgi:hypothetical protein